MHCVLLVLSLMKFCCYVQVFQDTGVLIFPLITNWDERDKRTKWSVQTNIEQAFIKIKK